MPPSTSSGIPEAELLPPLEGTLAAATDVSYSTANAPLVEERERDAQSSQQAISDRGTGFYTRIQLYSVLWPEIQDIADFLRTTLLSLRPVGQRRRPAGQAQSTTTHPYDASLLPLEPEKVPFYLVKNETMAADMTKDLFERVLPTRPVVNPSSLNAAKLHVASYETGPAGCPLTNKTTITDSTTAVLSVGIKLANAVGMNFEPSGEQSNSFVGVRMGSVVHSDDYSGGIAAEDKTPRVYAKHCTNAAVGQLCGRLTLQRREEGFRAIFFKLVLYMISENLLWGFITCALSIRIVRIEYRDERPFVIISGDIPWDSAPPGSIYSLVCYMLLTTNEELPMFEAVKAQVPAPTPIQDLDRTRLVTHKVETWPKGKKSNVGHSPRGGASQRAESANLTRSFAHAILHATAAANTEFVDISVTRTDKLPGSPPETRILDVYISDFLGAGGFGRVFRGDVFIEDNVYCGPVVIKFSREGAEEYIANESMAYRMLHSMHGSGIPRYYGHFVGEDAGFRYSAIMTSHCGVALESFDELSWLQKIEVLQILWRIHQAGVEHNDIRPSNIMRVNRAVYLLDFSNASSEHKCKRIGACEELASVADDLGLRRFHIWIAWLWSIFMRLRDRLFGFWFLVSLLTACLAVIQGLKLGFTRQIRQST